MLETADGGADPGESDPEAHRGAIAVESAPGRGATFTVSLPLAAPPAARHG